MALLTALGLSIPAGLNAYIPLLAAALAERFGLLTLTKPFDILGEWWVIAIIGVLLLVEVIADKIPAVSHANDVIQTVVRPAAGGVLALAAAGTAGNVDPWLLVVAGVIAAGGVHAVKATARPLVNVGTAGIGGPIVSTVEDLGALVLSIAAVVAPILVIAIAALMVFGLWSVWRRRRQTTRTG